MQIWPKVIRDLDEVETFNVKNFGTALNQPLGIAIVQYAPQGANPRYGPRRELNRSTQIYASLLPEALQCVTKSFARSDVQDADIVRRSYVLWSDSGMNMIHLSLIGKSLTVSVYNPVWHIASNMNEYVDNANTCNLCLGASTNVAGDLSYDSETGCVHKFCFGSAAQ